MEEYLVNTFCELSDRYLKFIHALEKVNLKTANEFSWDDSNVRLIYDDMMEILNMSIKNYKNKFSDWERFVAMKAVLLLNKATLLDSIGNSLQAKEVLAFCNDMLLFHHGTIYVAFIHVRVLVLLLEINKRMNDTPELINVLESCKALCCREFKSFYDDETLFFPGLETCLKEEVFKNFELQLYKSCILGAELFDKKNDIFSAQSYYTIKHLLLKHQLNVNFGSKPIWLQNLLNLCTVLIAEECFTCARHHLAVATDAANKMFASEEDTEFAPHSIKLEGEVAAIWIKYCLNLFRASKKKMLDRFYSKTRNENNTIESDPSCISGFPGDPQCQIDNLIGVTYVEIDNLRFPNNYEQELSVNCNSITNIEEANKLYEFACSWITKAGSLFNIRKYPVEHCDVMFDYIDITKCYSFFIKEPEKRYLVHLKREQLIQGLSNAIQKMDVKTFVDIHIEVARELAQVHLDLMNADLNRLKKLKAIAMTALKNDTQEHFS